MKVFPRWWTWSMVALAVGVLAIYVPFLGHPLLQFDDSVLITQNGAVGEVSARSIWYVFTNYDPQLYIPLTFLTYQIEAALFGMQPWAFHATNLVLHLLNVVLVAFIALRLTRSRVASIVTAAIFALHPLNAEAVLWASARKDVLSAFLGLGSILLYMRHREAERSGPPVGSLAVFLLALLAKVHAVVVPPLLFCIDRFEGRRLDKTLVRDYASFAVLAVIFIIIAVIGKLGILGESTFGENLLLLCKSAVFYVRMFLWPAQLSILYPQATPIVITAPEFFVPIILIVAIAIGAWCVHKRWPIVTFGLSWYGIALIPSVASFTKNGFVFYASDRYAYVGLAGLAMIVGWLADRALHRLHMRKILIVAGILLACILGVTAARQARVWRTEETLFQNVVDRYPAAALAWNNLAVEQMRTGQKDAALLSFQRAIDLAPEYTVPYRNLAHIAFNDGKIDESLAYYGKTVEVLRAKKTWTSDDVSTYALYALFLETLGRNDESFAIFQEALDRAPQFGDSHYNMGLQLKKRNKLPEALVEFSEAVRLSPNSADSWYAYAAAASELGRLPEALDALDRVLWLDPGNTKAVEHKRAIESMLSQ